MTIRFPRDLLLKRKWTGKGLDDVIIFLVSRGAGSGRKVIKGREIEHLGRSFMELEDGNRIPYHRIIHILYDGGKRWVRPQGSRNRSKTIRDIEGE